jgi:hypothetical protein
MKQAREEILIASAMFRCGMSDGIRYGVNGIRCCLMNFFI